MATRTELTVGQIAARSGLAVSTLHYYEAQGLIRSARTAGNQRRYARDVLRRLGVIKAAQRVGIPLASTLAALSTLPENRTPTNADWERLAKRWQGELDDRIERLTLLRDRLTGCIGCGCLSVKACPLLNPDDEQGRTGSGPRFLEPA
jgi:MerR family transcriptional regulator, redox-sensitive transcriptional activator SoxR